jgi:hypothetical protein
MTFGITGRSRGKTFPQSVRQFPVIRSWAKYAKAGNWPDADMLPIGMLVPTPGEGKPRVELTEDEQRTMITLWAARSPLFVGKSDADGRYDEVAADDQG